MLGIARSVRLTWLYLRPWLSAKLDSRGQGLVEYLVMVGLIAVVVLASIAFYGDEVGDLFEGVGTWLAGGVAPVGPDYPTGTAAPAPD